MTLENYIESFALQVQVFCSMSCMYLKEHLPGEHTEACILYTVVHKLKKPLVLLKVSTVHE